LRRGLSLYNSETPSRLPLRGGGKTEVPPKEEEEAIKILLQLRGA